MSDFGRNIRKWAAKTGVHVDDAIRAFVLQISSKIILRTPVDTGRARANWQASIGTPSAGTLGEYDKSGAITASKVGVAAKDAPGRIFYLVNNLPYIRRLEYDAWSKQAPQGMVRITVQEASAALQKAVRDTQK